MDGIDTDKDDVEKSHIWKENVHTEVNIFSMNMVCVYSWEAYTRTNVQIETREHGVTSV